MRIAFWSNSRKAGAVTCNLAAISIALAMLYDSKVILCSNHLSNESLQAYFLCDKKKAKPYYCVYGEAEYFRRIWEKETLWNYKYRFPKVLVHGISLIRYPDISDSRLFYRKVKKNEFYMMDIAAGNSRASLQALEEADLVVVFLPQKKQEIHDFFDRYASLIPKALFVISKFKKDGEVLPRYLKIKYSISPDNIVVIPYSIPYALAYEEGMLESFLKEHLMCHTKNPYFYFFSNFKQVVDSIYYLALNYSLKGGGDGA